MATYNLTVGSTAGVGATVLPVPVTKDQGEFVRAFQATLDIGHLVANGYVNADGDIFQLLYTPANTVVTFAGAEVVLAFNGTTPTVDIDWAAGDDIIDGGNVAVAGYLAAGVNGQTNILGTGAANTFTQWVTADDTIDVKLIASGADVTRGILRVYGYMAFLGPSGEAYPRLAARDQLA
jgi:hypothetical protein